MAEHKFPVFKVTEALDKSANSNTTTKTDQKTTTKKKTLQVFKHLNYKESGIRLASEF